MTFSQRLRLGARDDSAEHDGFGSVEIGDALCLAPSELIDLMNRLASVSGDPDKSIPEAPLRKNFSRFQPLVTIFFSFKYTRHI